MLLVGTNITSSADELRKIKVDYLYDGIRNPKPEIEAKIRQLRVVRNLDIKQYSILKRTLPYIVCGMFNPCYRRTDNFAYIEYFIIDIDKLSDKQLSVLDVRSRIQKDKRVVMCFLSPSEDGLKVLFRLKERCYDAGIYSLFYKAFIKQFSVQYSLEQVVDAKTCDVSRACFISVDPDVYYNYEAESIDLAAYLEMDDTTSLFDLKHSLEKELVQEEATAEDYSSDPDKEIVDRIKLCLNPKAAKKIKPPVYVPEQLDYVMEGLKEYIEKTGVQLYQIVNIQYGKKMKFKTGIREAEINLFFGKRGFSIVQSPRCGTSGELNELMAELIECYLAQME